MAYRDPLLDQSLANIGINPAAPSPQPKRMGLMKAMLTGNLDDKHRRSLSRLAYALGDNTAYNAWQNQDAQMQERMQADIEREEKTRMINEQRQHDFDLINARAKAAKLSQNTDGRMQYGDPVEVNGQIYTPMRSTAPGSTPKYYNTQTGEVLSTLPDGPINMLKNNEQIRVNEAKNDDTLKTTFKEDNYGAWRTSKEKATAARKVVSLLDTFPDMDLGPTSGITTGLAEMWQDLGFGSAEQAVNLAARGEMETQLLNFTMAAVEQTKGAVSEREMDIFMAAGGSVRDLPEQIRMRAEMLKYGEQQMRAKAVFIDNALEEGKTPMAAEAMWEEKIQGRDGVSEFLSKYQKERIGTMQGQTTSGVSFRVLE